MATESSSAPETEGDRHPGRSPSPAHRRVRFSGRGGASSAGVVVKGPACSPFPHGEDVAGERRVGLHLGPEATDVDVDETTVAEVVVAPDPVEQLFAAQHLVGVGGQLAQEPELGARAVHLLAVDVPQQPLVGEHFEVPEREHGRLVLAGRARRSSARMRAPSSFATKGLVT